MTYDEAYKIMFTEYPDILSVDELSSLLEISRKTVYKLLRNNTIEHLKIGREYRIPKIKVISYLLSKNN